MSHSIRALCLSWLLAVGCSASPSPNEAPAAAGGSNSGAPGAGGFVSGHERAVVMSPDRSVDAGNAGDPGNAGDADAGPARSTGPGDWGPGDYPAGLGAQTYLELRGFPDPAGAARQYKVHVPPSYRPDIPMPMVFCFHGLTQNAVMFCVDGAGMPAKADAAGFLLVMPNGYRNSWNGGTCCGDAVTRKVDDVGFVRALLAELSSHLNIDLTRVYATGLSNGGYMSYRLACEAADLFVAVAPGAAAIGMDDIGGGTSAAGDLSDCNPSRTVSVLDVHGTLDSLVPHALQKPSLERLAAAQGCSLATAPAEQPASSGDARCVAYEGCPTGVDLIGCTIEAGGHVWFGSDTCGTGAPLIGCAVVGRNSDSFVNTDAIWDFFSRHSR